MLRSNLVVAIFSVAILAAASPANAQLSFAPPVWYAVGSNPTAITTADLNRDGLPDVIVASGNETLDILMNNGDGTLAPSIPSPSNGAGASMVTAADFDGDGISDLASGGLGARVAVLLSRGDGTFRSVKEFGTGQDNRFATALTTGDFDRSGRTDLAIVNVGLFGSFPVLTVFRNNGDGSFTLAASLDLPGGGWSAVAVDVNGDEFPDLVTGNGNTNVRTVSVFFNLRNGTFDAPVIYPAATFIHLDAGDLNKDGAIDLVLPETGVGVMMNRGDGSFTDPVRYFTSYSPVDAAIDDFDGDGHQDVAGYVASGNPNPIILLRGKGDGSFEEPISIATFPDRAGPVLLAIDIDQNGAVDLIASNNVNATSPASISVIVNQRLPPVDHGLRLSTDHGGNTGSVTLTIFGTAIPEGSTVQLVCPNQPDIVGANVVVTPDGFRLTATFNLVGAMPGQCTVVVTRPDGTTRNAAKPFTIEAGGKAEIWVDIVGFNTIRPGRQQTFYIVAGNRGTINAINAPVVIRGIPRTATWTLGASLPAPTGGDPDIDWTSLPSHIQTSNENLLPLFLTSVAPGQSVIIPIVINVSEDFTLRAMAWSSRLAEILCSEEAACRAAVAILPIPGLDCVFSLYCFAYDDVPDDVGSLVLQLARVILECALDLIPGGSKFEKAARAVEWAHQFLSILMECVETLEDEKLPVSIVTSADPNDKIGSPGAGIQHFIGNATPLQYAIFFENKDSATAPAQEVTITDPVPVDKLDLATLSLGPIGFGDQLITPPLSQVALATTIDLRPSQNVLVAVNANLDTTTGLLSWKLTALDPATGLPPEDPSAGFLPPGVGGSVFFTVMPKAELPTGTQVNNDASIVFDVNAPIITQVWTNTLDKSSPTSGVLPLPATEDATAFTVEWAGTDTGSGVQDFTVYVSDNGGPFVAFQTNTTASSATFNGLSGHTYAFYSISRDLVGNVEAAKTTAETFTTILADSDPPVISIASSRSTLWPANGRLTPVQVTGTISDGSSEIDPATTAFAVVDEYGIIQPHGPFTVQANGSFAFTVMLAASRSGQDRDGRLYRIVVRGADTAGNSQTADTLVVVLHDQGK